METFEKLCTKYRVKNDYHGYHFYYPMFLDSFRELNFNMLEIGYGEGESLKMWSEYFHKANIYVVDIDIEKTIDERCKVLKGDQSKLEDLVKIKKEIQTVKVIVDDGSHNPVHQIETFSYFFNELLEPGGVYIVEDIECSYWNPNSELYGYKVGYFNFIEYSKKFIDFINHEYSKKEDNLWISSITYGQNCIIIKKRTIEENQYFNRKYRWGNLL
jgi:hypothetical protein